MPLPLSTIESALEHEFRSEAAATHGRLLEKLNRTLAALAEADPEDDAATDARVRAAGEALWHLVVQRDVMGFRNTNALLKELDVPPRVILAMGVR